METQVTYDYSVKMGYLHLVPPFTEFVAETVELEVNSDLNLDFDKNGRLIGIEFCGKTAEKLKKWAGQNHIFKKCFSHDIGYFYRFRISDALSNKKYMVNKNVVFHFSDDNYKDFLGIDLYDIANYSESFLVGNPNPRT